MPKKPDYKEGQRKARQALKVGNVVYESITKNGARTTFEPGIRRFKKTWEDTFGSNGGYVVVQQYKDRHWGKKIEQASKKQGSA